MFACRIWATSGVGLLITISLHEHAFISLHALFIIQSLSPLKSAVLQQWNQVMVIWLNMFSKHTASNHQLENSYTERNVGTVMYNVTLHLHCISSFYKICWRHHKLGYTFVLTVKLKRGAVNTRQLMLALAVNVGRSWGLCHSSSGIGQVSTYVDGTNMTLPRVG